MLHILQRYQRNRNFNQILKLEMMILGSNRITKCNVYNNMDEAFQYSAGSLSEVIPALYNID